MNIGSAEGRYIDENEGINQTKKYGVINSIEVVMKTVQINPDNLETITLSAK